MQNKSTSIYMLHKIACIVYVCTKMTKNIKPLGHVNVKMFACWFVYLIIGIQQRHFNSFLCVCHGITKSKYFQLQKKKNITPVARQTINTQGNICQQQQCCAHNNNCIYIVCHHYYRGTSLFDVFCHLSTIFIRYLMSITFTSIDIHNIN